MDNLFLAWAKALGFNLKELSKAGSLIGMLPRTTASRSAGKRMEMAERLAMSAVVAGLPEWSPEHQRGLEGVRRLIDASQDIDFKPSAVRTPES